jgi:hypothetical protein|tara:strand:+ start:935 stop:2131 length:1197 start_codon:yes stop_codon:yes gene_type:complete
MKKLFRSFGYPEVVWFPKSERNFLTFISIAFLLAMFVTPYPQYAMWLGFLFAAYAAVANDSIQTLGTFIASNQDKKWWVLWMFIGGVFLATHSYSWFFSDFVGAFDAEGNPIGDGIADGDVSHGRLLAKGFEESPTEFHFLQIAAPIFLLILTRLRMPVSTTFILLTSFAASPAAVGKVMAKSMSGYVLAFFMGLIIFSAIAKISQKYFTGKAKFGWTIAQWITTGSLWSVWLTQDAANIAVYLPRSLSFAQFAGFAGALFIGLGLLLYYKGGRIQKIVTEKSVVTDVRFATLVDFVYCIILFYFKLYSQVPMSTTWVFIGLLGGRELGMALRRSGSNSVSKSIKLILKDFSFAMIGLVVSIAIAIGVNDQLTFDLMVTNIPKEFANGITKFFTTLGF